MIEVPARGSSDPAQREKMALGAAANRAVDSYLRFLSDTRSPGRRVNQTKLQQDIRDETNLAKKTILIARLHNAIQREQLMALQQIREDEFLKHVNWFSEKHEITYQVWREMGVPVAVLKKAGIDEHTT